MNSIRVYGYWCVLSVVLTLALPAGATTIIMPTDEQLIEKSSAIVRGTVISSQVVELNGGIWTETVLTVQEVLKGDAPSQLTIREVGGQLAERETVVFGSPQYRAGEEVLAFLWLSPRGHYQTMDLFLGKFSEEWTIDGKRLWYRADEAPNTVLLDQNFELIEHENVQRDAAGFSEYVRDAVAGRDGSRNYGVVNPKLVRSFQSNFEVISEPTIYRWFAFQDGKSISWQGHGSQPGYSNGGADDTKTAMAAWTGYGEALIRYTWGGMSSASPGGLDKPNGINEVIFNDPLDEISGSWTGQGGVVGRGGFNRIAGARSWSSNFSADGTHTSKTYSAHDIIEGNLVIQDGVSPSRGISSHRFAEIVAHEFGHTLGFGHSDDSSALMYSSVTGLGPSLRSDDQLAARWLYPSGNSSTVQIPAAPSNLAASALSATTLRLTWADNSNVETSQTMYVDAGGGYVKLATVDANVSSSHVGSLKSGQTYSFRVTASNSAGESSASNTATLTMPQESVTAAFSVSPTRGTAGETTFVFSDQSSGPVASWQWSFGDGTGSTTRNPSKLYQTPGTYQVSLTVRNSAGQQSSASKSLQVTAPVEPVVAAFTVSPTAGTAGGTTFVFSDQSSGPVTSWQWSFGDGTGATVRNPSKVYQSAGTYSVTLTVKGSSGQQSSRSDQVLVGSAAAPAVTASFDLSASSVKENQQIAFYDRSSGSPSWWQWGFGDGKTSMEKNPTHAFVKAGTYQVTLKAGNATSSSTTSRTVSVTSAALRFHSLVPVSTTVSGVGGTNWRTDLTIFNASTFAVGVDVIYLPGAGEAPRTSRVNLGAGRAASWQNVLADLFGIANGAGALHFKTESSSGTPDLRIASRTYTGSASGTYGQFVGDLRGEEIPKRLLLAGLSSNGAFRSNVGIVNRSTGAVNSTLSLYGSNGSLLGRTSLALAPSSFQQQPLAALFPTVASQPQDQMSLEIVSTVANAVTAYGSIIDNVSQDPVFVPARVPENASDIYVAAVGRTGGAAGTYWRSDVTLFNPGVSSVSATIRFLRAGEDNRFADGRTVSVGPKGTRTLGDVMKWLGVSNGTGALQITWSGHSEGIVVTSRTYTTRAADAGTLGQSIGMTGSRELGRKGIVTGLSSDDRFRANIGLLNSGSSPIDVTLRLIAPDGRQLGSTAVTVAAKSQMQRSAASLFGSISFVNLGNFTILAEASGSTMFVYGSVIDNQSGDPIFVSGK